MRSFQSSCGRGSGGPHWRVSRLPHPSMAKPRVVGTVHQQQASSRYRKYTCGCGFLFGAVVCLALGGILPRSAEVGLVEKYRTRIVSDSLDDPLPEVGRCLLVRDWLDPALLSASRPLLRPVRHLPHF